MNSILITAILLSANILLAQKSKEEILAAREHHLESLLDTSTHLLKPDEIENFIGLNYFDFDSSYQIFGKLIKNKGKKFEMPVSKERKKPPMYRRYGFFHGVIGSDTIKLAVYQSLSLKKQKQYKNYLFLPFRDGTTRNETYGGGRFLELEKPEGERILIDFNEAFNPYCAYSYRYSCPIPPEENTLKIEIRAGEKTPLEH